MKTPNNKRFTLNDVGEKVAISRYYQKNEKGEIIEDWDGLVNRVVKHVCGNEPKEFQEKMVEIIGKTEFLPNSPCLVNAGRKTNKAGLMACYVSKAPEDTWESMCDTIKNFGDVARAGGGCGVFLGNIRPEGSPVFGSTHAKACGPIEHMRMISEVMSSITQAGFRGMANMASLNVSHPDIINFIKCKQTARALKTFLKEDIFHHYNKIVDNVETQLKIVLDKFISNFNISVLTNDTFMEAVEKDSDWELSFNGKIYQTLKAKEIFDLIAENAWKNGDPGIFFGDTINNTSPYRFSGQKIETSNPCQPSWSKLLTKNGIRQLKDIHIGEEIWSKEGWSQVVNKIATGIKKVYSYRTTSGCFYGTENHKLVSDGEKIEARHCESIDIFAANYQLKSEVVIDNQDIMDGLVLGDGSVHKASNNLVYLCVGRNDYDYFESEIKNLIKLHRPGLHEHAYEIDTTITCNELPRTYERSVPDRFYYGKKSKVVGFLRGLYSANGSVCGNRITLKSASFSIIEQVQTMLSSLGIRSYYTTNQPNTVKFSNGEYLCKKSYDLNISIDRGEFYNIIGFIQDYKNQKVFNILKTVAHQKTTKKNYDIISTDFVSEEEVYDITVNNESHTYWTQGCNVSNCGEQLIPSSNSNCNLGSIDVSKFYDTKKEDVDWSKLQDAIKISFQFLDNVIDIHDFPAESFKQWGMDNRPVGLGIMGFADLLLLLKIKYGSKESIVFGEKLMKFFADISNAKSIELAKIRGTPKSCDFKELSYRRNVTTTSIAPTGSISLLAGCSSSIEPIFSPITFRHDNTGSYEMKHPDADSEWFACALDDDGGPREVKYQEHVSMQSVFQKHCDSGISKTINFHSSATVEDIKNAYMLAWKSGCKGITVYRNNSKTTQVLNQTNKVTVKIEDKKAERPHSLTCDIFNIKADGRDWHIIVGLKDGNPYELFAVNGSKTLPDKGLVVKIKKKHYSLLDLDKNVLLDNIIESENKIDTKIGLETRRFSLELRHGIPTKFIVEQIDKSTEVITSFSKAAARIFKKHYLPVDCMTGSLCPECLKTGKESKLIHSSSCTSCPICFFSKCG